MSDLRSREKIINEIDTNFFVEAGAGSGKTTILVERMVAMVEKGIPVEKICTITFTKDAANEFYERFQKRLIERSRIPDEYEEVSYRLPKPTKQTSLLCQIALENIDLCFMGTIDSFCNMILSEHPTEANVPSDAKLIDDDTAKNVYRQFYVKIRKGEYGKELSKLSDTFSRLYYDDQDSFASLMKEIMDRRNIHFNEINVSDKDDIYSAFLNERNDCIKVLNKFNEDPSKIILPLKEDDDRDPIEVFRDYKNTISRDWKYNYTGVMAALKNLSVLQYEKTPDELGFKNESIVREAEGKTILNVMDNDNPRALYYLLMDYKYQISMKLLLKCIEPLEELMRNSGQFTFFDYLFYLRNMLKTDAKNGGKLINYIYDRHSYFMIDEFQDTNPMQAEVFFYLASERPHEDYKKCKPRNGSLFIVGDPKQSIYRFRSADVSSYLKIKKLFENGVGEVLYLSNNFRSRNVMKSYFNDVFNELMPEETKDQSAYKDIENTDSKENKEFEGIYTYDVYSGALLEDNPQMSDDMRLLKIVESLVNNEDVKIKGKTLTYKDFMIIFNNKKSIGPCISTFKKYNIPIRVEGKILFDDCVAFKTIYSIFKAVTNIHDNVALIETLYNPVFGLNDNDLTKYRKNNKSLKIKYDEDYDDSLVGKALNKLKETSLTISSQTPSSLYEKIMDDYEIFKYVSSDNLEIVYYVLELLRSEEQSGNIVNFEDAIKFMDDLINDQSGLERCLSLKQNVDAVHIANLHKVKGLEAPVVILAKAGVNRNISPDLRIEYDEDKAEGYVLSFKNNDLDTDIKFALVETSQFSEQKNAEVISQKAEHDRLTYVAATRARNVLIMAQPKQITKTGKIMNGTSNKWAKLKDKASGDIFDVVKEKDINTTSDNEKIDSSKLYSNKIFDSSTTENYLLLSPSTLKSFNKIKEDPLELEGNKEITDETYSTLIGTMVHRLMEMIIMSKDKLSKQDIVENILDEYQTNEFIEYTNTFKTKLNNVYDVIHNGGYPQINGAIQDILPVLLSAEEIYSEVPFTYKEDNTIINGIIDLIYRKDNKLHIIDWKTNKSDKDLADHYKEQLNAYINAIEQITNEKAEDALIYHIKL